MSLTPEEKSFIAQLSQQGFSKARIAKTLNRNTQTVSKFLESTHHDTSKSKAFISKRGMAGETVQDAKICSVRACGLVSLTAFKTT